MKWNIIAFETKRGEKPVEAFIKQCQSNTIAKITGEIDLLETYGNMLGRPHSAPLGKGLFELRIRGREEIRILYGFVKNNIYLVHAFKKKTQNIPRKEMIIAQNRLKDCKT